MQSLRNLVYNPTIIMEKTESRVENVTSGACRPAVPHNVCSAALYAPGAGSYIVHRSLPFFLPPNASVYTTEAVLSRRRWAPAFSFHGIRR